MPRSVLQKEGEFTLHSRAILEMEQYIRETYPDAVKICNICHSLLIQVPYWPAWRGRGGGDQRASPRLPPGPACACLPALPLSLSSRPGLSEAACSPCHPGAGVGTSGRGDRCCSALRGLSAGASLRAGQRRTLGFFPDSSLSYTVSCAPPSLSAQLSWS